MPAAAVIPAPQVYIYAAAVKKARSWICVLGTGWLIELILVSGALLAGFPLMLLTGCLGWLARLL